MKKLVLLTAFFSLLFVSSAYALITESKHNLSSVRPASYTDATAPWTTGTTEVCIFCHTPHGSTADAPLWNRAMATGGSYSPYQSTTMDSIPGQPAGISLACLSCHDGTIALDALRNTSGSGTTWAGFPTGTPPSAGWTFNNAGAGNVFPTGRITNLGQDLRDDHPISMRYPNYTGQPVLDNKFYTPTGSTTTALWFEEAGGTAGRADDNEIKLYPTAGQYRVECASCHNPHGTAVATGYTGPRAPNSADYPTFLRKSNLSSALCVTCHIK